MCGRFTLTVEQEMLIDSFDLLTFPDDYMPRYNIAPTQNILAAVHTDSGRKAGFLRWGLVPYWVKDTKKWKPLINARVESLTEKASFKHLLNKRRCIIFADSFYEWKVDENGKKIPYRFMKKDEAPFAFAGLWDRKQTTSNNSVVSCTIITTQANELVKDVHERMPVMLTEKEAIESWLNTTKYSFRDAKDMLQSFPSNSQKCYQVSLAVNNVKNDNLDCIQAVNSL
ncbi:SOS response-associated peptidase [Bacillus kwashiorkori]|uniref:SOS response-associated peptidase n=1 Tax=Bacillus kwashiorkori TaxID=1522318 RepID=UPI000783084E|nr:SOS response-associated peptidase [Bacillus kwashiorkori]